MNQNYEPMDIDLSAHSNNAMDISYISSSDADIDDYLEADDIRLPPADLTLLDPVVPTALPPNTVKKFHINIQREKKSHSISSKFKVICSVIILLLSLATYQVLNIQCSDEINLDKLENSLSSKLFGQTRAASSLIESLKVAEKSKILFFYGGTGVGKTLAASMILDQLGRYSNVYHYLMPSFMDTFTTDFMVGLSLCKHTTIVIDDLSTKDMNVKFHIQDVVTKSQNLGNDITVILVFNCDNTANDFESRCDDAFPNKLLQNFSHIDAFKKLIKFDPLNDEHLRQCIQTELGNKSLNEIEFKKLLKNFNVSLNGCKGVYTKMKMLEIS